MIIALKIGFFVALFFFSCLISSACDFLLYSAPISWHYDYGEMPSAGQMQKYQVEKSSHKFFNKKSFLYSLPYFGIYTAFFLLSPKMAWVILFALPVLILLAKNDMKYQILPDQYILALLIIFVIYFIATLKTVNGEKVVSMLLGAMLGGGFFLLISLIGAALYKQQVIGMGDVKLCAVLGLFLGTKLTVAFLLLTLILAGVNAIVLLILHCIKKSDYLPLCPYITASFILTVLFAPRITEGIELYMGIFGIS